MSPSDRADLYALLAETLAEPPDWMSLSGREWPLFETATSLASESEAARRHLDGWAGIPSEGADQRRERYASLFASGRPRFWLYESAARTGKILGPQAFEIAKLYRAAGLEPSGAELPDHVSLELAFLAYLVGQIGNLSYEKQFLEQHGAWMIDLGRALAQSGDLVYAPIGQLLADWLTERLTQRATYHPIAQRGGRNTGLDTPRTRLDHQTRNTFLPLIPNPNDCTLCGFCAQVCPTRALAMRENETDTLLVLDVPLCIGCGKCERICEMKTIALIGNESQNTQQTTYHPVAHRSGRTIILRRSPHARCKTCGKPIASQAEMDYIVSQVGEAAWQRLCLDCRAGLYV